MKRSPVSWPRKGTYWLVGTVLLLPVLLVGFEHYRGKWALARWKANQEARGEAFAIRDLSPPELPETSNAYSKVMRLIPAIQSASELHELAPPAFRFPAPGKAILSVRLPAWEVEVTVEGKASTSNVTWAAFSEALKQHDPTVRELQTALAHGILQPPVSYHAGFSAPLPHLVPLTSLAQHLCPAALVEIQAGRLDSALDRIECLTSLGRGLAEERLVISQLVRIAIYRMAVAPTWQALQLDGWNEHQLRRLQTLHENEDFLSAMTRAVEMERAMQGMEFDLCRHSSSNVMALIRVSPLGGTGLYYDIGPEWMPDELKDPFIRFAVVPLWQVAWSYSDELHELKSLQTLIENARLAAKGNTAPLREALKTMGQEPAEPEPRGSYRYLLSSVCLAGFPKSMKRALMAQTQRELVAAAIALKRYHLAHGRWPSRLPELVPDFLAEAPRDYLDGQTLRYRLENDGSYALYSVGENAVDEGGDAIPEDPSNRFFTWQYGRDLVWPKPASPEEIAAGRRRREPSR